MRLLNQLKLSTLAAVAAAALGGVEAAHTQQTAPGGDIVVVADENYNTLYHLTHRPQYRAQSGGNGKGQKCAGRNGLDLIVLVPIGTVLRDLDRNAILKDMKQHGERVVICKGGMGGRGNRRFATSTDQSPRKAESGRPGRERRVSLDLKMIADVGLVGLPNAGKSTLLACISAARPKVAGYPFTTLVPNLGIVKAGDYRTFVAADLPGIIEGAHTGKGLGAKFLRHIERTRVILHLVDVSVEANVDPIKAYRTIRKELESYSPVLAGKPEVVIATKIDLTGARKRATALRKEVKTLMEISSPTGKGLPELVRELFRALSPDDELE